MELTFQELEKELRARKFRPLYLLYGEESYFIDKISNNIEDNLLDEAQKGFNQSVVYGADTNANALISSLKRYPVMSPYQLIILKEAHRMKDIKKLIPYLENPVNSSILVICYKNKSNFIDKRTKAFKAIDTYCYSMASNRLYEDKVPAWITSYIKQQNYSINPEAAMVLTTYVGADLSKLSNELDKLMLNVRKGSEIHKEHIEKFIGISKEYNVFELQNALAAKNHQKVYRMLAAFIQNPKEHHILKYIGALFSFYVKLFKYHELKYQDRGVIAKSLGINPYFIKEYAQASKIYDLNNVANIIGILHEYDLKAKGVASGSQDSSSLFKEMIFKILN